MVSYRDLDTVDGQIVRNAAVVRSIDGGQTFEPAVKVADDDWFIDGCPFTGPSAVNVEGTMVLAWMDARQSSHPDQAASSIWVDRSTDGGANFGADLEVVGEGRHRWPSMAVDDAGVIHLVWETEGPDGGLSYSWSDDAGRSFAPTHVVGRSRPERGKRARIADGPRPRWPSDRLLGRGRDRFRGGLAGRALTRPPLQTDASQARIHAYRCPFPWGPLSA